MGPIDFSSDINNLSLNESSEQTVVKKINDRNIRNVVQQEHTKSEVFDLSLDDNDIMGEYTVLDNNFEIDKSTFCTNMYDTKYCDDVYSSYITTGTNYLSDLVVNGNTAITGKTFGTGIRRWECVGNLEETFIRGADLNKTTTVGNDYEYHLTVTGHKKIVSKTTGGASHDYFNAGEGKWDWVTMGDLVQNYTRNKDVTTTLNVGTNLTNTTTVGNEYEDNLVVNGNARISLKGLGTGTKSWECVGNLEETFIRGANLTTTLDVGGNSNIREVVEKEKFFKSHVLGDYTDDLYTKGNLTYNHLVDGNSVENYETKGNRTEQIIRGADLNRTTTVGQNYEDHLTVMGNKSIHLTNTGNVSYEKKTDGNASTNTETKGNVEENYMRHQNLTIKSEVGDTLTKTTTVGKDYVDNFTVNGNITENCTIIGDVTKTIEQSGTTVVSYMNNNQLVKTVSSVIDPNDSNIIGVQNSEIIESGEIIYKRVKGVLDKHEVVDNYKHTLTIKNGANQDGTMETYKYKKLVLSNGETLLVLCLDSPQI